MWRNAAALGAFPGLDRLASHAAPMIFRPRLADRLTVKPNPAVRDLVRHALADVSGNTNKARAWAKFARRWPGGPQANLEALYGHIDCPVLLLWADHDAIAPLAWAEEIQRQLPDAQLRTIPDAGFLPAYEDPVATARELIAFLG